MYTANPPLPLLQSHTHKVGLGPLKSKKGPSISWDWRSYGPLTFKPSPRKLCGDKVIRRHLHRWWTLTNRSWFHLFLSSLYIQNKWFYISFEISNKYISPGLHVRNLMQMTENNRSWFFSIALQWFKSRLSLIVRVNVVLNRTVVVDSDWRFDNLCGSHFQSQNELYRASWWYYTLVIDLIG